ncbi:fungal protein [Schizosaccharomyces cryophilus OY26]|uniref:Fungal protein n=1 Tax=Schizosaccharomyces cryophilus (strain OY26 / ATCC MYA-4695 / CBS 11777 / NBRC 106824 / NRRL Y48691) TaxID=653667 RepID=S9VP55_SCHCR|nr:uncharacterized protein SPOG_03238 [Schizosaccharomyces cryophilus OY26]EPY49763.1 fungal protein [Schizosaccharomyces cryophilus OY26]
MNPCEIRESSFDEARRLQELERVLKSGWLIRKSHSTTKGKHLWGVLRRDKLSFYKDEKEYKTKLIFPTQDISAVAYYKEKSPKSLYLYLNEKIIRFVAPSNLEAESWVQALRTTTAYRAPFSRHPLRFALISSPPATTSDPDVLVSDNDLGNYSSSRTNNPHGPSSTENGFPSFYCTSLYDLTQLGKLKPQGFSEQEIKDPFHTLNNNNLRKHKHSSSLQNLYKMLDENKVLMQGPIYWRHGNIHRWSKCWAVVRGNGMTIYNSNMEYKPVKLIPITEIQDVAEINIFEKSRKYIFTVITLNKPMEFRVDDEDTLILWVAALKTSLDRTTGVFGSH